MNTVRERSRYREVNKGFYKRSVYSHFVDGSQFSVYVCSSTHIVIPDQTNPLQPIDNFLQIEKDEHIQSGIPFPSEKAEQNLIFIWRYLLRSGLTTLGTDSIIINENGSFTIEIFEGNQLIVVGLGDHKMNFYLMQDNNLIFKSPDMFIKQGLDHLRILIEKHVIGSKLDRYFSLLSTKQPTDLHSY